MDFDASSREKLSSSHPIDLSLGDENLSKPRDELTLEDSIFSSKGKSSLQDLNPFENLIDLNASSSSSSSSSLASPIFTLAPSGFDLFDNSSFGCTLAPSNYHFYEPKPFELHGGFPLIDNFNHQSGVFLGHSHMVMPMINFVDYSNGQNQSLNQNQSTFTFIDLVPTKYPPQDEGSSTTSKQDNVVMDAKDLSTNTKTMAKKRVRSRRFKKITNVVVKGPWTPQEDSLLIKLVERYGLKNWSFIARYLNGRIGKQCRERWTNHLRPHIKKDGWSEQEDKILINAHVELGNKWAEIARRLPGRTENSIKNHWNATKRKQLAKRKYKPKYPRQTSLLQEYIKSLSLETINVGSKKMPSSSSTTHAPPLNIDNTIKPSNNINTDVDQDNNFEARMLDESSIDSLLDGDSSMDYDDSTTCYDDQGESSFKPMNDSQGEVRKELDLVEKMKHVNL